MSHRRANGAVPFRQGERSSAQDDPRVSRPPTLSPCPTPGCPGLHPKGQPCPECGHGKAWAGSQRRQRLGSRNRSGSAQQARTRRILRRDGYICHVCKQGGADQADHVVPLSEDGADDDSNLAAIHDEPCHRRKTAAEAARARAARRS